MKAKEKNKKITVDKLAGMVQNGFVEVVNEMRQGFAEVNKNIRVLSENNTRDHEAIKLRLDNKADRFEIIELDKRVVVLEKKAVVKK